MIDPDSEDLTLHKAIDLDELLRRLEVIHAQYCHRMRYKTDDKHFRPCGCTIHNLILDVENVSGTL